MNGSWSCAPASSRWARAVSQGRKAAVVASCAALGIAAALLGLAEGCGGATASSDGGGCALDAGADAVVDATGDGDATLDDAADARDATDAADAADARDATDAADAADAAEAADAAPRCDGSLVLTPLAPLSAPSAGSDRHPALADLNGDGVLDIAVATQDPSGVDVFLSAGGLRYTRTVISAGIRGHDALLGDMDGDGKLDLVLISYGPDYTHIANGASLFLGAGDGTFGPPTAIDTGDVNPISGALADFDGDGKLDLAVNHNNGGWTTSVLLNQGGGHFAMKWSQTLGTNPHYLAAADFDGDGKPDLAVSTYYSGLKVVLNKGDGTFGATMSPATAGGNLADLAATDLDGDGKIDLAVLSNGGTVSVLLNDGTPFSTHAEYAVTTPSEGFAVADLDGKLGRDLVAGSNPSSYSALLNKGDGTFGAEKRLVAGNAPGGLSTGDLDRDGRPDLVGIFGNDSVAIVLDGCGP
jgi:FG-GAP-like repeat